MNGLGNKAKDVAMKHVQQKAARDILKEIKEWRFNKILTANRRWLFELIQNAIDTAKARNNHTLKIYINKNDNSITFKHNGGYFTLDEISAVIYGGSSKPYAPESVYIGRFGTGFLVTHIVSREVRIKGFVKDNEQTYKFEMNINREGNDEESISNSIEQCFQALNNSELINSNEQELYTEFIYFLKDELGREAVKVGVEEIKKNLPFVCAFNNNIQEITIDDKKFVNQRNLVNQSEPFIEIENDNNNEIVVAIAIKDNEVMELKKIPKIYVGIPLIETADDINIPFVINSINFEPTKERDFLSSDNEKNKELLRLAFEIYKKLLKKISGKENIKGLFRSVDIRLVSDNKPNQNPLWIDFNDNIKSIFTQIIEEIPLVETFDGKKEIKNTFFPTYGYIDKLEDNLKKELFTKFYSLAKQIKKNIPMEDEVGNWRDISENLKKIKDFSALISLYSIEEMKRELDDFVNNFFKEKHKYPKYEDFADNFHINNPKQFFHSLYEIFDELYQKKVISSSFIDPLLPDQGGYIRSLKWAGEQVHIDEEIPEKLKDILENIGWVIKNELLDKDFTKYKIVSDYVLEKMSTDSALDRVIKDKNLRPIEDDLKKDEWDKRTEGWVELFRWCIKNNKLVVGFPVFTKDRKVQEVKNLDVEDFIIPFKYISIDEKYEDIYPENRILHHKYFDNSNEIFDSLENYKTFIRKLPVYKNALTIGYDKLKSILTEKKDISKVNHKIESNEENISILPFWNEVVGRISESQERAKLLFEFVVKYLLNHDDSWEKKDVLVNCDCKDKFHKIIPSHWLASLKSDKWVPCKVTENNEEKIEKEKATKESIEKKLFREEFEELIKSQSDKITQLLFHFGFDELDLTIKLLSIEENKPEPEVRKEVKGLIDVRKKLHSIKENKPELEVIKELDKLIDMLKVEPDLPDMVNEKPGVFREVMKEFREKSKSESIKDENKRIGKNVEKIIAKVLSDKGLTVRPIYKGGDLEIWPENEGWDSGLIEIESYFLEVKFTSGMRVHLSKTQSEMAQSKKENYLVLVVENADNLREQLKEIDDNSISDEIINGVVQHSKIIEEIYTKLGVFVNPEEIEPDLHGYWVKKKLWADKNDIIRWIKQKFGDGV
ncbi:MAG: hypothetical protein QXJ62_05895 [Nitrososphaeria archaeon]